MSHYYGFTPDIIRHLTIYQFHAYLDMIGEVYKIFNGQDSRQETDTNDMIDHLKQIGVKPPKGL